MKSGPSLQNADQFRLLFLHDVSIGESLPLFVLSAPGVSARLSVFGDNRRAAMERGFEKLGLNKISAHCDPRDTGSCL